MVYYGLSFSTRDLGSDEYWTFFISGAVEIPALIYATLGIRWFGRKNNMIALELIGGAACLATIFIGEKLQVMNESPLKSNKSLFFFLPES